MSTPLRLLSNLLVFITLAHAEPATWDAPHPGATPFNQLSVSGNACGPAAFLNSLRFSDPDWQRGLEMIAGGNDRTKLSYTLRVYGLRPSSQLAGRTRWSRVGINVTDLVALGNEVLHGRLLPTLQSQVLLPTADESPPQLLARTHATLAKSLRHGLPPIISIRRLALRSSSAGKPAWITIESHFITLLRLPRKLDPSASSFAFDYLDPWGGKRCTGTLQLPPTDSAAYGLTADLPLTPVGKKRLNPGERSLVTLSAAIGHW